MIGRDEFEFANDVRAAVEQRAPRTAWLQILTILLLLIIGVAWAWFATVEEVTTGDGRVIPSSQTQFVQTLEGGIVRDILVKEGDLVEKDQVLMRIDDTSFSSKLGELREKRWSLRAEIARLDAEANGATEMTIDAELEKEAPAAIAAERASFIARIAKLDEDRSILKQQVFQRKQELLELEAKQSKLKAALTPLKREVELTRKLSRRGVVPEVDLLRLERQLAELVGEVAIATATLPRAKSAIEEAQNRLKNARATFGAEARVRSARVRAELAVIEETLRAARDRVVRASLKAPARGVVNKVNVTTIGAVVQPGFNVVEIVPLDDTMLIETRIRPKDVAFIRPDQTASVKLTAYDYLVFGSIPGKVERISADTLSNAQSETFYRVMIRTERAFLERGTERFPIIPGMVASVDILTGKKSVLSYLLKPINRVRNEALRER